MFRMSQIYFVLIGFAFGCSQVEPTPNQKGYRKSAQSDDATSNKTIDKTTNDHFITHFGLHQTSIARPKIADRFLVTETLLMIFGPTAKPYTDSYVLRQAGSFGGPCEHYGEIGKRNCGAQRSQSQLSLTPFSITAREAWRMKTCENITVQDAAITYAVATTLGYATDVDPDIVHIRAAYELFYPGRETPKEVQTALLLLVQKMRGPSIVKIDAWRTLLLTLCLSSGWQIL